MGIPNTGYLMMSPLGLYVLFGLFARVAVPKNTELAADLERTYNNGLEGNHGTTERNADSGRSGGNCSGDRAAGLDGAKAQ
jgi:hypothetical protein